MSKFTADLGHARVANADADADADACLVANVGVLEERRIYIYIHVTHVIYIINYCIFFSVENGRSELDLAAASFDALISSRARCLCSN